MHNIVMQCVVMALSIVMAKEGICMDNLMTSMRISGSGLQTQSDRLRIITQNIANVDSTGLAPGEEPYRRKIIIFKNQYDPVLQTDKVVVRKYGEDNKKQFRKKYDPSHPAANEEGIVLLPNVDRQIEGMDAKEAQRSYEANLSTIEVTKSMLNRTIDILR